MTRVWISAGSNVDKEKNIRDAIDHLQEEFGSVQLSPVYQTRAEGFDGDDFLNLVIGIDTRLSPKQLRQQLRHIEDCQGRIRGDNKFASRTLDLDLLTWGDLVDEAQGIPRDEILNYAFVLKPLADIAPEETYPGGNQTYKQLWEEFAGNKENLQRIRFTPDT